MNKTLTRIGPGIFTLVLSGILMTMAPVSQAESRNEKLLLGNQLYEKGQYDQALEAYLSLVQQGYAGSTLFYNLGNTYYRKGERGKAILWFERSQLLDPRDNDIEFNLNLTRSHLKDEGPNLLEKIIFFFSERELAAGLLILIWIYFGLLGARIFNWVSYESWSSSVLWISGVLLLITTIWFGAHLIWDQQPRAIITSLPGEVRNGPGTEYAVGFTVPEGTRVIVLDLRPGWVQVGIPQQGVKGWMPQSEVELINLQKTSLSYRP